MDVKVVSVLLALCVSMNTAVEEKKEPMVAFVCNRPSMYRTETGWTKDDNTGCLRDPVDILNYCRKVFPHLDVRNVVESNDKVTIDNWCAFGHKTCRHQFTVRPFRCLVGPFQSDALLVPEHCIFDHIHDSKICTSYGEWNKTATGSCNGRTMHLQSFSMLQPCGIDKFNGVEFVCCPNVAAAADAAEYIGSSEEGEEISDEVLEDAVPDERPHRPLLAAATTTTAAVPAAVSSDDPFSTYMNRGDEKHLGSNGHKWNEHDYFVKAMDDMRKHHEDKINKMMKNWAAARQRVQELKARDAKAAEKLNKEITARFQKTYDALEVENALERKQLSNLHQQRVQSELNEKKRRSLDDYMQAIDDNKDAAEILRSLKQHIKVVQKDRLHTINRYKHLRDTDPAEAEALRQEMADHLRTVDQQMTIALEMLDRVPRYKKKIQLQIDDYLDAYHAIDASVNVLLKSLVENPPTTVPLPRDDMEEDEDENVDDEDEYGENEEEAQREERDEEENEEDDYSDEGDYKNVEVPESTDEQEQEGYIKLPIVKKVGGREDVDPVTVKPVVIQVDDFKDKVEEVDKSNIADEDEDKYEYEDEKEEETDDEDEEGTDKENYEDEDEDEDYKYDDSKDDGEDDGEVITPVDRATTSKKEYSVPSRELDMSDHDFLQDPEPAHIDKSYISVKEPFISKASHKGINSFNAAVPIGITVGAITILVVILVGVVVMRRRAHRRSLRTAVNVRLDPAASPEERHIAAMQMTGYENPTYKYFEQSGTATA